MTSAEQGAADSCIGPIPLTPHRFPAWLLGFAALAAAAVTYLATLVPPYPESRRQFLVRTLQ